MTSSRIRSGKQQRPAADWSEFYKNGQPQEVIIINDDTPPPYATSASSSASASSSVSSSHPNHSHHHHHRQVPNHHHYHHSGPHQHRSSSKHDRIQQQQQQQQQQQHSYHNNNNTNNQQKQKQQQLSYPQEYGYHGSSPRSQGIIKAPPPQSNSFNHSGHNNNNSNNHSNRHYVQGRPCSPEENTHQNSSSNGGSGGNSNGHYHHTNNNKISSAAASMPLSTGYAPSGSTTGRVSRQSSKRQPSDHFPFDPAVPISTHMPQYTYADYPPHASHLQEPYHLHYHHRHHHQHPPPPLDPVYHYDPRDYEYPVPYPASQHHQSELHIHMDPYRGITPPPHINGSGYPPSFPPPPMDMYQQPYHHSGLSPVQKKRKTINVIPTSRRGSANGNGVFEPYGQETMHNYNDSSSGPSYGSTRSHPHQQHRPPYPEDSPPYQPHAVYPVLDQQSDQYSSSMTLKRKLKTEDQDWSSTGKRNGESKHRPAGGALLSGSHHNNGVVPYHSTQHPPVPQQQKQPLPPPPTTSSSTQPTPIIPPWDDKEGHYIVVPLEDLTPRYKIIRLLGQGTFGKVVECYDRETGRHCAIKVIRAVQKYRDASKIEARVLSTLKKSDPKNTYNCLHLMEIFDFRNHVCMVFELLGQSIYDWLKDNYFCPFPPNQIQQFAKQLLTSVAFLHRLRLIHTDLKPENILLANGSFRQVPYKTTQKGPAKMKKILTSPEIRLIDFGSATFQEEHHSTVVSTRHYRAPEIILGLGWSYPCDIWSIGCILVELLTGEALFQTHDNLEHLAMMQAVLGHIPDKLIRASHKTAQKFFVQGRLDYPNEETKRNSRKFVKALRPLRNYVVPAGNTVDQQDFATEFLDLLSRLLAYDPSDRITAAQALRHPYFNYIVDEHGQIRGVRRPYGAYGH